VTFRPIRRPDLDRSAGSVIGKAIPDLHVHVLDRRLQPVPLGIPGEMYIGGAGVARGYLRRPELTAERFVPDPFCGEPGARLYRSGDLARRRPEGDLEFLGRIDQQVKIRGFRIELGEIEERLREHPEVQEAAVLVRRDAPDQAQLVAYAVGRSGPVPGGDLRSFLKESLPDYMVPEVFMALDAFPRTAGGKVDRRALPAPDGVRPQQEVAYTVPRTELERTLAGLWQEVLRLDQVGIHDNFFDLGGNSLLLVQVHGRLRERLGAALPLVDLIRNPTILALARHLDGDAAPRPPAPPRGEEPQDRMAKGLERLRQRREAMDKNRDSGQESSR
jgi:aryl carrier-like protein